MIMFRIVKYLLKLRLFYLIGSFLEIPNTYEHNHAHSNDSDNLLMIRGIEVHMSCSIVNVVIRWRHLFVCFFFSWKFRNSFRLTLTMEFNKFREQIAEISITAIEG